MKKYSDEQLATQINILRGLNGVEQITKKRLLSLLNVKDNIFSELVKANLIIKTRKGKGFEYFITKNRVFEHDVRKALANYRNRCNENNKKRYEAKKTDKLFNLTEEVAISYLKQKGYRIFKEV